MPYSLTEIKTLIKGFEEATLPSAEWTHEKHLIMALWYLHNYNVDEGLIRIRSGIIHYNLAQGNQNTADSGYHETLTLFWIIVISHFLKDHPGEISWQVKNFITSELADKALPLKYYSKDLLFSIKARARWVPPDLSLPPWMSIHGKVPPESRL